MEHFYQNIGEDWFSYPNLYKSMVEQAHEGYHFVEVGSWKGRSAAFMAVEIINSSKKIKFDCIDSWQGSIEHLNECSIHFEPNIIENPNWLYNKFLTNIEPVSFAINHYKMTSLNASDLYKNESLDFVFIDASHEYEDVKNDINNWLPKVKIGGVLAGHDYGIFEGVTKAVNELFLFNNIEIAELCWIYNKR